MTQYYYNLSITPRLGSYARIKETAPVEIQFDQLICARANILRLMVDRDYNMPAFFTEKREICRRVNNFDINHYGANCMIFYCKQYKIVLSKHTVLRERRPFRGPNNERRDVTCSDCGIAEPAPAPHIVGSASEPEILSQNEQDMVDILVELSKRMSKLEKRVADGTTALSTHHAQIRKLFGITDGLRRDI